MLVTFSTPAYANITLFNDVALRLLKMMGHSGTVPSAILGKNVPTAVEKLRIAIANFGDENSGPGYGDRDFVSLAQRARPLIELLEAAAAVKRDVMWDDR